jgi:hypothetical protein
MRACNAYIHVILLEYQEGMISLIKECQVSQIYTYKNVTALRASYKQALKESKLLPAALLYFNEHTVQQLPELPHVAKKLLMLFFHRVHAPGSLIVWGENSAMVLEDSWIINGGTPLQIWMPQYRGGNGMRVLLDLLPK